MGVTENTVSEWKLNKKGVNGRFLPIKAIKKIKNICKTIKWKEIEKNVMEYKTRKDTNSIKSPILPIKDSKELREIVIHIMADGCAINYAAYYNHNKKSKDEFIRELRNVFGKVETRYYWDHVNFPMAIAHILSDYFKVNFLSKKCRVPKHFFISNKEYLIATIRAMIIDEGCIDWSNIRIDSTNGEFSRDIKKVCRLLKIGCGKTWKSSGPIYRFNILAESIQEVYNKIKPLPIENKEFLLKLACNNQKRNWKYELPGETKKKIVKELLKNPLSSVEMSTKLNIPRKVINKNTKKLEEYKIIQKIGKKAYTSIYDIKDENNAIEFIKNPYKFLKGNKLDRYGKTQLLILRKLYKNKKCTYTDLLKTSEVNKSALFKCLKGMCKKKLIKKLNKKYYYLNKEGKEIMNLPENIARYVLYSNIKDFNNIYLNGFGK